MKAGLVRVSLRVLCYFSPGLKSSAIFSNFLKTRVGVSVNCTAMPAAYKLYATQKIYLNYYKGPIIFQPRTKSDSRLVNLPLVNILPTNPGLLFSYT